MLQDSAAPLGLKRVGQLLQPQTPGRLPQAPLCSQDALAAEGLWNLTDDTGCGIHCTTQPLTPATATWKKN